MGFHVARTQAPHKGPKGIDHTGLNKQIQERDCNTPTFVTMFKQSLVMQENKGQQKLLVLTSRKSVSCLFSLIVVLSMSV
jgi:hypothetical protein